MRYGINDNIWNPILMLRKYEVSPVREIHAMRRRMMKMRCCRKEHKWCQGTQIVLFIVNHREVNVFIRSLSAVRQSSHGRKSPSGERTDIIALVDTSARASHTKEAEANAQALVKFFCCRLSHVEVEVCGYGGGNNIFLRTSARPKCMKNNRLR